MSYTTLISVAEAAQHLGDPQWVFVDCRFRLNDADQGRRDYLEAHIPGAVYAHLDRDLSGPIIPGETGRHPLPAVADFAETLSAWGIGNDTQVVAYDDMGGLFSGRLWWMLRWLGHDAVAVLNGDFRQWLLQKQPVASGLETPTRRTFVPHERPELQVNVDEVLANVESGQYKMFDARDEARYRGEAQGMDPVAGHIPGAQSAYFAHNLDENGLFLPPEQLRARFKALLGDSEPKDTIFYCGSGVSVHNNLLAMMHAGMGDDARVYIGSWSDWINDPNRPVATGDADMDNQPQSES